MPAPESRSTPGPSMSIALLVSAARICSGVKDGFADLSKPAIAAACGAAAEVPKNGLGNPPTPVTETPSAAVMSGFWRRRPPVAETSPGVISVPSAWKKMRRGPSELNSSTVLDELKGFGNGPVGLGAGPKDVAAGVAAQPKALAAELWPCVCPAVAIERTPRLVFRCRNRSAAPVFFTITMRKPKQAKLICSYGSCV